jgi:hypothetical protein
MLKKTFFGVLYAYKYMQENGFRGRRCLCAYENHSQYACFGKTNLARSCSPHRATEAQEREVQKGCHEPDTSFSPDTV